MEKKYPRREENYPYKREFTYVIKTSIRPSVSKLSFDCQSLINFVTFNQ